MIFANPQFGRALTETLGNLIAPDPQRLIQSAIARSEIDRNRAESEFTQSRTARNQRDQSARDQIVSGFQQAVASGVSPRDALGAVLTQAFQLNPDMARNAPALAAALGSTQFGTPGLGEQGIADLQTGTGVQNAAGTQIGLGQALANALARTRVSSGAAAGATTGAARIRAESAERIAAAQQAAAAQAPIVVGNNDVLLNPQTFEEVFSNRGPITTDPDQTVTPFAAGPRLGQQIVPDPAGQAAANAQAEASADFDAARADRERLGSQVLRDTGFLPGTRPTPGRGSGPSSIGPAALATNATGDAFAVLAEQQVAQFEAEAGLPQGALSDGDTIEEILAEAVRLGGAENDLGPAIRAVAARRGLVAPAAAGPAGPIQIEGFTFTPSGG